ncbi:hypothetical protein D1K53_22010 [Salmonella enterica]|uniref:Uncharacterized protein n=2 Tax=Salmonella enterica subsp. arizonae serovar 18:z4,z23:- TaxID=1192839 RepID=A0A3S5YI79_SALER|nr:hypothetical protein N898_05325 [Salmonella enterica subsp. arizonae serovar 62:z36:- str. RKS2983]ASO63294.1 hypothetical protein LFZ50_22365 [Salmonella enterica subsp. arizonae serovar 53:-:- str. SA20100345]AXC76967.1 hypothetical protein DOE56_10270 [Salmonella enterica subsp. arizonae serovar 63:g,z51:-]EAA7632489.1 hypothetical protein [Salmonella enterica]EAC0101789.1 hypothetical protein [Salmonella enterica subsp. arizonae]EAN8390769.1 hypothetical protein [Salmonella enterica sub
MSSTDYLMRAGVRKNSPDGSIPPDCLTKKFVAARKSTDIEFSETPPPFLIFGLKNVKTNFVVV